ncbi:Ribonuclease H-like protein [Gracilaria domingensis]|nr:Ribonuclease H-like protein [Gracilaria domingensis]
MNTLAEIITVLKEVRRVARQFEAEKQVTLSRAPRVIRELHETLQIMAGDLLPCSALFHDSTSGSQVDVFDELAVTARATIVSIAGSDVARNHAREIRLTKPVSRNLCRRLGSSLNRRLGALWKPVAHSAATWTPIGEKLGFGITGEDDVNECELEYLGNNQEERDGYFELLYDCLIREVLSLDASLVVPAASLKTLFRLLHQEMREKLNSNGRREPNEALLFWKNANASPGLVSPVPFNVVARAFLGAQASSAAVERLFSSLGLREGSQCRSLLSSTSEMCELIRVFVANEVRASRGSQSGLVHPNGESFRRIVRSIASLVWLTND